MIVAAAFCPHPPLLVPAVAAGAAAELDTLRAACTAAIERLVAAGADQLVLIGAGVPSAAHSPLALGTLAGLGVAVEVHLGSPSCGGEVELPLSLTIGAWLLERAAGPRTNAVGYSVGADFATTRAAADLLGRAVESRLALLVMGDGTACLSEKSPGYLDGRAAAWDDVVTDALTSGDGACLEALDPKLGTQLLSAGVPAWRVAGSLLTGSFDAHLLHRSAPYGVSYLVASWTAGG